MADSRKRGVRASRIRLEQAMREAELPRLTQAALAERIADLEALETAPRDMVSRVFREQPVDPQSIERVARALGVPTHTLYLTSTDPPLAAGQPGPVDDAETGSAPKLKPARWRWFLLMCVAGAVLFLGATVTFRWDEVNCRLRALTSTATIEEGRLGVLIARFEGDQHAQAQRFVADRFLDDAALAPFLSVVTLCDTYSDAGPGDRRVRLDGIRGAAQRQLARAGAHVLLWGERLGDVVNLRLVSTRTDLSPQQVELGGKSVTVDERFLEIPLDIARPELSLPDLKKLSLTLMQLGADTLNDRRNNAMASYRSSIEWLQASVVTDRNLRSSIRSEMDPTRWALVNAQLCYKYRLLGDYESSQEHYESAIAACEAVLEVRPQAEFPQDWAAVKTNLGSAWLRLHAYAPTLELAVERLQRAGIEIESAAEVIDRQVTPQLWAVNRRILGTILIRLGELGTGPESSDLFDRGVAELQAALDVQRPEYQPLDWALTQQNICLAMYQHGARLGQDGLAMVREAINRCQEAASWLSPGTAALSWAMVQNNIAASTATLAQLEGDPDLLTRAAEAFREAARVYTRDRVPVNWAEVEVNLGELTCNLALMRGEPALLDEAIVHVQAALEVFLEHGIARYQRHAEHLLANLDACDREAVVSCRCGD
ncbi:MAG: hypothetical protein KDI31_01580 [Pseudomonadales bacterium]|nr:hypothetical protein [Pseudomonadales bacterium]